MRKDGVCTPATHTCSHCQDACSYTALSQMQWRVTGQRDLCVCPRSRAAATSQRQAGTSGSCRAAGAVQQRHLTAEAAPTRAGTSQLQTPAGGRRSGCRQLPPGPRPGVAGQARCVCSGQPGWPPQAALLPLLCCADDAPSGEHWVLSLGHWPRQTAAHRSARSADSQRRRSAMMAG